MHLSLLWFPCQMDCLPAQCVGLQSDSLAQFRGIIWGDGHVTWNCFEPPGPKTVVNFVKYSRHKVCKVNFLHKKMLPCTALCKCCNDCENAQDCAIYSLWHYLDDNPQVLHTLSGMMTSWGHLDLFVAGEGRSPDNYTALSLTCCRTIPMA